MSYESKKNAHLYYHQWEFFYKTQWAWQGVKLTRLMSIFTSEKLLEIFDNNSADLVLKKINFEPSSPASLLGRKKELKAKSLYFGLWSNCFKKTKYLFLHWMTQTLNTGNNFLLLDKNWTKHQISPNLDLQGSPLPPNLDAKMAALPVP